MKRFKAFLLIFFAGLSLAFGQLRETNWRELDLNNGDVRHALIQTLTDDGWDMFTAYKDKNGNWIIKFKKKGWVRKYRQSSHSTPQPSGHQG